MKYNNDAFLALFSEYPKKASRLEKYARELRTWEIAAKRSDEENSQKWKGWGRKFSEVKPVKMQS